MSPPTGASRAELLQHFGLAMTATESAAVLGYATVNAMRMAMRRGTLDLKDLVTPGKRERCFATEAVARLLER